MPCTNATQNLFCLKQKTTTRGKTRNVETRPFPHKHPKILDHTNQHPLATNQFSEIGRHWWTIASLLRQLQTFVAGRNIYPNKADWISHTPRGGCRYWLYRHCFFHHIPDYGICASIWNTSFQQLSGSRKHEQLLRQATGSLQGTRHAANKRSGAGWGLSRSAGNGGAVAGGGGLLPLLSFLRRFRLRWDNWRHGSNTSALYFSVFFWFSPEF